MELRWFMLLCSLFIVCFGLGFLLAEHYKTAFTSILLGFVFGLIVMINSYKAADPGTLAHTYKIVSTTSNSVTYLDEDHNLHEIKLTEDRTKVFQDGRNVIEIYEGSFMGVVAERSEVHMSNNNEETADSD